MRSPEEGESLRVVIVGAGKMGREHAAAFASLEGVEVVGVASRGGETAKALAARFGIANSDSDWRRLVERRSPHATVIAVSHEQNLGVTRDSLSLGLHTLSEKPVAFTSGAVEDLGRLATSRSVIGMAAVNRRYYPSVLAAIEAVRYYGGLVGVTLFAPDPLRKRRAGGNQTQYVYDHWTVAQTLHAIDLIRLAGGDVVEKLSLKHSNTGGEFNTVATMQLSSGALATYVAMSAAGGPWELRLHGQGVEARLCPLEEGRLRFINGSVPQKLPTAKEKNSPIKEGIREQAAGFVDAVRVGRAAYPASTLDDHAKSIELAEWLAPPF